MILQNELEKLVASTVKIVKTAQQIEEEERKKREGSEQGGTYGKGL